MPKRARVADIRKALVAAMELGNAGILFVPIPVLNKEDGKKLTNEAVKRLDIIESKIISER